MHRVRRPSLPGVIKVLLINHAGTGFRLTVTASHSCGGAGYGHRSGADLERPDAEGRPAGRALEGAALAYFKSE